MTSRHVQAQRRCFRCLLARAQLPRATAPRSRSERCPEHLAGAVPCWFAVPRARSIVDHVRQSSLLQVLPTPWSPLPRALPHATSPCRPIRRPPTHRFLQDGLSWSGGSERIPPHGPPVPHGSGTPRTSPGLTRPLPQTGGHSVSPWEGLFPVSVHSARTQPPSSHRPPRRSVSALPLDFPHFPPAPAPSSWHWLPARRVRSPPAPMDTASGRPAFLSLSPLPSQVPSLGTGSCLCGTSRPTRASQQL